MPTTRKLKPRTKPRETGTTKDRVQGTAPNKPARVTMDTAAAEILNLQDGEMLICWTEAETVPTGKYANVVVGPVMAFRKIKDPGDMSEESKKAIKAQYTFLKDTIEEILSEDRWQIEAAVARYAQEEDGNNGSKS